MDTSIFGASPCGRIVRTRTGYDAFVPDPLPPPVTCEPSLTLAVERASLTIGELAGLLRIEPHLYLPLLQVRDAVESIRAEGHDITAATYFEAAVSGGAGSAAVRLAGNYVGAFDHARLRREELPVSLRLVRELHFVLLDGVADPRSTPGQFRRSQNWLGQPGCSLMTASFVPPPTQHMHSLLDNWERFLHESNDLPSLVRLSLAHCQFLIMQPFLDMNVLSSAVIAPVILQHLGVTEIVLPLFGRLLTRHGNSLQQRVLDVCATGRWEEWLAWYLHGVADAAREVIEATMRLHECHDEAMRRTSALLEPQKAQSIVAGFFRYPMLTRDMMMRVGGLTSTEASNALNCLESAGFLNRRPEDTRHLYEATGIINSLENSSAAMTGYPSRF